MDTVPRVGTEAKQTNGPQNARSVTDLQHPKQPNARLYHRAPVDNLIGNSWPWLLLSGPWCTPGVSSKSNQ